MASPALLRTLHFLSTGGKPLVLYLKGPRETDTPTSPPSPTCPSEAEGEEFEIVSRVFFLSLSLPLLKCSAGVEEVYKRLRSQVRGSQRRLCRCLSSAPSAVLEPCSCEHNIVSYIICRLCEDVFAVNIKKHRKLRGGREGGLAASGARHCSQSHRDYPTQGPHYLIVAQIDYCLAAASKLVFTLLFWHKRCFPTLGPRLSPNNLRLTPFLIRGFHMMIALWDVLRRTCVD